MKTNLALHRRPLKVQVRSMSVILCPRRALAFLWKKHKNKLVTGQLLQAGFYNSDTDACWHRGFIARTEFKQRTENLNTTS